MRGVILAGLLLAVAVSGSTAAGPAQPSSLQEARSDWAAAEADRKRLDAASAKAADQASSLALERLAAAAAIASAEARISVAEAELALRRQAVAAARAGLAERQRPVAGLVAAMVNLERRPPLLALAGGRSIDELVRTRALLGAVIPHIRSKSAALASELARARRLESEALGGQRRLIAARAELDRRRTAFAALERQALERAQRLGAAALEAGDTAIVAEVGVGELESAAERASAARKIAGRLAVLPPAPPRPFAAQGASRRASYPLYALPIAAPVLEGQGAVDETGIRARGIRLDARRGARLAMPADGTIVFSGPFRRHDGVVILDHGAGWMTMLVNARADSPRGTRLERGQPLGTALGELTLELSRAGRHVSPAVAAAQSRSLSIQAKRR